MIYNNLEKIYETTHIENKYALAMIVSMRARQLSEQKGRLLDGESSERYITYAISEIESQKLNFSTSISHSRSQNVSTVDAE
ncbi:MAG: DNA-directed RNA polymerase subunit omega [Synergistaceae bacterium]|jgi:DNA-directed RNA polymerase omega subunit|nr:DNA-directed RNA polymerase subunit omega [Synergistaceae bacterium]